MAEEVRAEVEERVVQEESPPGSKQAAAEPLPSPGSLAGRLAPSLAGQLDEFDNLRKSCHELKTAADALRAAAHAATVAAGDLMRAAGSEALAKNAREPLQEVLRKRLRRISEVGAMSILQDQEDFDHVGGEDSDDHLQRKKLQQAMSELENMRNCLGGLTGDIARFNTTTGQILEEGRSVKWELDLRREEAYVSDIGSLIDGVLRGHWSLANGILPEYCRADETICVRREWMCSTILGRHVAELKARYSQDLGLFHKVGLRDTLTKLIRKGYNLEDDKAAMDQKDVLSDQNVFKAISDVFELLESWKKPLFFVACKIMLGMEEDCTAIVSKLSEVVDHSLHCPQVKVKGFQVVMSHSARLLERHSRAEPAKTGKDKLEELDEALLEFYACFQDFLDDHKERAFSAAFVEPAHFYCSHSDQGQHMPDNTVPHAINWYLSLLNAALGAHLPLEANYSDDAAMFTVDFWLALKDECWQHFSHPEHFGRAWQGIAPLARGGKSLLRMKVRPGHLPHSREAGCGKAKEFANNAVNPQGDAGIRRVLSLYLERFAYFFSRDFFIRRAFEVLNSENKPEHVGFRKACATLYSRYRSENANISEETLVEHVYPDDPYFTKLDIQRMENFFVWLKVLKVPSGKGAKEGEEDGVDCSCRVRFMYRSCEEDVSSLISMGFSLDKAKEAWLACLGRTEAAVGVLMGEGPPPHGLPKGKEPPDQHPHHFPHFPHMPHNHHIPHIPPDVLQHLQRHGHGQHGECKQQ